jgi:hypothetical protein
LKVRLKEPLALFVHLRRKLGHFFGVRELHSRAMMTYQLSEQRLASKVRATLRLSLRCRRP